MATTVVTKTSFLSRIGNSIKGVFIGIVLVIAGCILLFWNEGRAVKTAQSLKEGASSVVSISSDSVNAENEGKLVHFTGDARTPSVLIDTEFGVGGPSLKLRRTVEVYQWVENAESKTVEKLGGSTETTTVYGYKKDWRNELIDSTSFKEQLGHQNPTAKSFESNEWLAQNVSIGAFTIPEDMVRSLSDYQPLPAQEEMLTTLPYELQSNLEIVSGILYYKTNDPANPQIGDTRITYENIAPQKLSVIAQQKASSLTPYQTKNGRTISFIQTGEATAQQMFQGAIEGNKMMTWVLRILGIILLFAGFRSVLGLLPVIGSFVPFIGKLVGAGMSFISGVLAIILGLVIIAFAWILYRPIIGIGLLLLALVLFVVVYKLRSKK